MLFYPVLIFNFIIVIIMFFFSESKTLYTLLYAFNTIVKSVQPAFFSAQSRRPKFFFLCSRSMFKLIVFIS